MESCIITRARVYVTSKCRYVRNNRFGIWVELAEFKRKSDYLEHCRGLFVDEPEPIVIHLDWQDIPSNFISENGFRLLFSG